MTMAVDPPAGWPRRPATRSTRCRDELTNAVKVLMSLGDIVDDLKIPTVEPRYSEVAGFNVVTGVSIGASKLADRAGGQLVEGAQRLGRIALDLAGVAEQLRGLGSSLGNVGGDLRHVGTQLGASGTTLRSLAG